MNRQAYPRDLTDQHWSIIEPLLPPAKSGGHRRSVEVRALVNGALCIFHAAVARGECCRMSFRLGARYTVTIDPGAATAPGRNIHDALREQVRAEPRNPVPGLLTVRRSRPRN